VFETYDDPLEQGGHCHYFGLTGAAEKATRMFEFMYNGHRVSAEHGDAKARWLKMDWCRECI